MLILVAINSLLTSSVDELLVTDHSSKINFMFSDPSDLVIPVLMTIFGLIIFAVCIQMAWKSWKFVIVKIIWPLMGTIPLGFIWYDYKTDVVLFVNPDSSIGTFLIILILVKYALGMYIATQ